MDQKIIDAEVVSETPSNRLEAEMQQRAMKVATIFANEPKSLNEVIRTSDKQFGFGENMTRQLLTWLDERKLARSKLKDGVVYWGKPVDVKKIVEAAAGVVDVVSVPVEALGGEKAAKVMREAAATVRSVAPAVEGIKREAAPVVDAVKKLGDAAREAGFFRLREPLQVSLPKREKQPTK